MSVTCNDCSAVIEVTPKVPFQFFEQDGRTALATDYTAVYEHVRDTHPESWTAELVAEYEQHCA